MDLNSVFLSYVRAQRFEQIHAVISGTNHRDHLIQRATQEKGGLGGMTRAESMGLLDKWVDEVLQVPPEYHKALNMGCLRQRYMSHTSVHSALEYLNKVIKEDALDEPFLDLIRKMIRRAYSLDSSVNDAEVDQQVDLIWHRPICKEAEEFYNGLEWRQKYMHAALRELERRIEDDGTLIGMLSDIAIAGYYCKGRKRFTFNSFMTLLHKSNIRLSLFVDQEDDSSDEDDNEPMQPRVANSRRNLLDYLDSFIDDFKLQAYRSAFSEPAKTYLNAIWKQDLIPSVELHGINVYTAILTSTLGVLLPMLPYLDDPHIAKGTVQFLNCKDERYIAAINELRKPEHFGKEYLSLPSCKNLRRLKGAEIGKVFVFEGDSAREIAIKAILGDDKYHESRLKLAEYLERFMYFFQPAFFLEKLIVGLTRDRPQDLQILFEHLKATSDCDLIRCPEEEDYRYWIWDVMTGEMNAKHAYQLISLLGILRPISKVSLELQ